MNAFVANAFAAGLASRFADADTAAAGAKTLAAAPRIMMGELSPAHQFPTLLPRWETRIKPVLCFVGSGNAREPIWSR
jgi:hypothetical protein